MPDKITEADLNAYVDGELDTAGISQVEAWLSEHPDDFAAVEAFRRQSSELHRLYDTALTEPVPPILTAAMSGIGRRRWFQPAQAAAGIVLVLAGAAGGWLARDAGVAAPPRMQTEFVDRAIGAHVVYSAEVRHPVEVGVSEEKHLVAWLSKRLGHALRAPELHRAGFKLMGGRLLPDDGGPAAQFMYENADGRRITLYVRPQTGGETAFQFFSAGKTSAFYWTDEPFSYALAGDISRDELLAVCRIVYDDLDAQHGGAAPGAKPDGT